MAMLSRPLQYQSLKSVLLNMDANVRFLISLQMPSIRNVEKMLPLRIDHLDISEFSTKINDTGYGFGIFRHYPDGNAPRPIKFENSLGGYRDFDEFGFPVASGRDILLPGDVLIKDDKFEGRIYTAEDERHLRQELKAHEQALEMKTRGISVDYLRVLQPLFDNQLVGEEYRIRNAYRNSSMDLSFKIGEMKCDILPFDCRRNNTKPPFTCFIQLTIEKGESRQIQRFEYTNKLFEAVKHLNDVFFGSRTMPIQVASFDFKFVSGIFRLPPGFRLQVKKVHVTGHSVVHEKLPVLVENSKTLDSLWMHYRLTPDAVQSQIVRNAKKLVLADVSKNDMQGLFPTIRDLPNQKISIWPKDGKFSSEDYFQIIEAWLSRNRPIGATCSIRILTNKMVRDILKLVETRNERTKRTKRSVTIRKSDSTKVEVFYVRSTKDDSFLYTAIRS